MLLWLTLGLVALQAPEPTRRILTLVEAQQAARDNQPTVRQATATQEARRASANVKRAPLLPQLDASANYSRRTDNFAANPATVPGGFTATKKASDASTNYYTAGLQLRQLIYDFGATYKLYEAANATARSAEQDFRTAWVNALYTVTDAFFAARKARADVGVQVESLANQARHREQIEVFVRVGRRPQIDLLQARADYSNARVQWIAADFNYRISLAKLNQAMGSETDTNYDVADEESTKVTLEDGPLEDLLNEALQARPDYLSLAYQMDAQTRQVDAVRGAYWPSFSAQAGLTEAGRTPDNLAWNWSLGLSLDWSLFGGGTTFYTVSQNQHSLEGIRAQYDALRQQVRLDVEQARFDVLGARAQLEAAEDARLNSEQLLRLAEGRYTAGVGSVIEQGDAQTKYTQAAGQKVQSEYSLASARARLRRALGRLDG